MSFYLLFISYRIALLDLLRTRFRFMFRTAVSIFRTAERTFRSGERTFRTAEYKTKAFPWYIYNSFRDIFIKLSWLFIHNYYHTFILLYARAYAHAFYKFSNSSITSITNKVIILIINCLDSDRRVIEGVIVVIEERFFNCKAANI